VSMPFYMSPEQVMRDKSEYARTRIARGRSCVALQYTGGILLVAPNPSRALHKISELYDRIAFAAGGEVVILPVSFLVDGQDVVFRTGTGSKLSALEVGHYVGFEADSYDAAAAAGWSW